MNGTLGDRAMLTKKFIHKLKCKFNNINVHTVDESSFKIFPDYFKINLLFQYKILQFFQEVHLFQLFLLYFLHKLKCKFNNINVHTVDERLTTVAAHKTMNW